jgi:hypothetical protein
VVGCGAAGGWGVGLGAIVGAGRAVGIALCAGLHALINAASSSAAGMRVDCDMGVPRLSLKGFGAKVYDRTRA